jgi:hypothetical protein
MTGGRGIAAGQPQESGPAVTETGMAGAAALALSVTGSMTKTEKDTGSRSEIRGVRAGVMTGIESETGIGTGIDSMTEVQTITETDIGTGVESVIGTGAEAETGRRQGIGIGRGGETEAGSGKEAGDMVGTGMEREIMTGGRTRARTR